MASIERTAYPRFRQELTDRELQELFTPTTEEIAFARDRARADQHYLALMVLLKCLQYLGYFPDLPAIPPTIVNHLRVALRLPLELRPDYDETRTLRRHQAAILQYLGLKASHGHEARKVAVAAAYEAAQVMTNTADLINAVIERLRAERCELPHFTTLDRLVYRVRGVVHRRIFRRVQGRLTAAEIRQLDALLNTEEIVQRHSAFQELKEIPKKPSLTHLDLLLDHLDWLESLQIGNGALADLPSTLVRHFALEAKALHVDELRVVQPVKRYTLLLCLLHQMRIRARDDLVEMFIRRMQKIHNQARQRLLERQARQRETAEHLVSTLAGVLDVVGGQEPAEAKMRRIEGLVAEQGGLEVLRENCETIRAWSNNNYFPLLAHPYQRYRHLLFRLVRTLHLESTTQDRSLLAALNFVMAHQHQRTQWASAEGPDLGFASEKWRDLVFRTRDGQREMHRRQLEICVFTHVALDLRSGDLAVTGSESHADYRTQLLPWSECEKLLEAYCDKLGLPETAQEFVERLRNELQSAANAADAYYAENAALVINPQGEPVLKKPPAKIVPPSAVALEAAIQARMPEQSVIDILWLVNSALHFTRHFGPLSGLESKLVAPEEHHCLTIFAMGSGLGPTQGARHMQGLITPSAISRINRHHVTVERLEAAHRDILDPYSRFDLPGFWGSGKTAAFDGTLFELAEQNLLADFHFRYRLKGAIAFQVVSDLYIALFTHFIPPGVWEAVYIIEALSKNRSRIQPDTVFADTQGQSTPVFAFTYLLGIKLMPRIRNWEDLRFYRPAEGVHYHHIDALFKETIDWNRIETHWRDLMQVALSIYTGRISSSILLRKLGNYSRKNRRVPLKLEQIQLDTRIDVCC